MKKSEWCHMRIFSFLLAVTLILTALIQGRPIDDVDIFTQLRLGTNLIGHNLIGADSSSFREFLTYSHDGELVRNPGWLSQVVLSAVYHMGGWRLVRLFHAIVFSAAFGVALYLGIIRSRRNNKSISCFSYIMAFTLGSLVSISSSSVRPQGIAFLCFALVLLIRELEFSFIRKFFLILAIGFIWQNCHPSIILGVVVVGSILVSNVLLEVFFYRFVNFDHKAVQNKIIRESCILVTLGCLQIATPLGLDLWQVSAANHYVSRELLGVSEWMSPWHESVFSAMKAFWGACVISLLLAGSIWFKASRLCKGNDFKQRDSNSPTYTYEELMQFVPALVLFILTLYSARFCVFWALVMIPVWVDLIERAKPSYMFNWGCDLFVRTAPYRASYVVVCVSIIVVISAVSLPVTNSQLPISCVNTLKGYVPSGRIYNYREWGGILSWYGSRSWKIAIDGRLYLYDLKTWIDYEEVAIGKKSVDEVVNQHSPSAFFLRKSYHQGFIQKLNDNADWIKICEDDLAVAYVPKP